MDVRHADADRTRTKVPFDKCTHDFWTYDPKTWDRVCESCGAISTNGFRFLPPRVRGDERRPSGL